MKRKHLSTLIGSLLCIALIATLVLPLASANAVTVEVLNPLAYFEPQYNQPLTSRADFKNELGEIDLNGKVIGLSAYSKVGNTQGLQALGQLLMKEFPDVIIVNTGVADLGSPWNNKTEANYNLWAGVTALTGTARRMLPNGTNETTGSVTGRYLDAVIFGISDCNVCTWWSSYHAKEVETRGGVAAVVVNSTYASTHAYAAVDNGFTQVRRVVIDRKWNAKAYSQAGASDALCLAYYRDHAMVNLPIDTDYAEVSKFEGERAWLSGVTPYEQLKWALAGDVTESDMNPPQITQETYNGALAWKTREFSGSTYEKAAQAFNDYAMDYYFGDGLPLVLPTKALVNEMLAGTTRDKDEVIGKMKMRGGVITVEKIAINAVMAGAKPEHLPVLIAAMEAYANGWENDKMWYHNMSTGAYSMGITMIINGPLAKELGLANERGYAGSGQSANNLIGRAFRLCVRNIGHNYTPDIDTTNRLGRLNDINLMVIAEAEDELPAGWKPHHVMMGYEPEESTITMIGAYSNVTVYNSEDNVYRWTPQSLMENTRAHATTTANIVILPPGAASVLADETLAGDYYLPSKEAMKEWYATHNATSGPTSRNAGIYNMTYPIVVGGDPNYIGSIYGFEGLYATLCYQTQLISGATMTENGRGATVPSTPQNFAVAYSEDGKSATLTWDEPLSDGGSAITGYQVCNIDGGNRQTAPWTNVAGGAEARSYTFTNLVPGMQYFFRVRATNGIHNASEFTSATTAMNTTRASGKGAWSSIVTTSESIYTVPSAPQIFTATPGDGEAVLNWTAPANNGGKDILRYEVSFDNGETWIGVELYTSFIVTDMEFGVPYLFKVRAVNEIGNGEEAEVTITLPIAATSIKIDAPALVTLKAKETLQLNVTATPEGANPEIVWTSSNPAVAVVDENGLVTAIKIGTVQITAKTADGSLSSVIAVRVAG